MLDDQQRKRAFRYITLTQCLGMIMWILFQNGFYLNYFVKLGISSAAIAMLFALPSLLNVFLLLPFAFFSDRFGKQKLALLGQILLIFSLVITIAAAWWSNTSAAIWIIITALLLFSIGGSLQQANWFALLNPIIPKEIRGRFFGRLRVTFQLVCIVFTLLITQALEFSQAMATFQVLLGIILVAAILRYFTYAQIPELENNSGQSTHRPTFRAAIKSMLQMPGYIQFNSYVFLITLFTASVPTILGLMQKDVFAFSPADISTMGTLFLLGSVIGCGLGGRIVDRYGTRFVFLVAHITYAIAMLAVLTRHWAPWPLITHIGACTLIFSLIFGMASVAITSEVLALISTINKALSSALSVTLTYAGVALSGIFVSSAISQEVLAPEWQLLGHSYTAYDTLLIIFATMILLMLATIGLVTPIMKKSQLMPGGNYPS